MPHSILCGRGDGGTIMLICPQCGEETESLNEGYCEACTHNNYSQMAQHEYTFRRWEQLNDAQRWLEIRLAGQQ